MLFQNLAIRGGLYFFSSWSGRPLKFSQWLECTRRVAARPLKLGNTKWALFVSLSVCFSLSPPLLSLYSLFLFPLLSLRTEQSYFGDPPGHMERPCVVVSASGLSLGLDPQITAKKCQGMSFHMSPASCLQATPGRCWVDEKQAIPLAFAQIADLWAK